jgi:hypothetical protein
MLIRLDILRADAVFRKGVPQWGKEVVSGAKMSSGER